MRSPTSRRRRCASRNPWRGPQARTRWCSTSTAPSPGTFAGLFTSADPDAIAFLQSRYGNIRLAETLDDFNRPGRALMKDGFYDDGLVRGFRTVERSTFKIGKAAQAAAMLLRRERAEQLRDELDALDRRWGALAPIDEALRALSHEETIADLLATRAELLAEIARQDERIAAALATSDGGLRERKRGQVQLRDDTQARIDAIARRNVEHELRRRKARDSLRGGEELPGSDMALAKAQKLWKMEKPFCTYRTAAHPYRLRLDGSRGSVNASLGGRLARLTLAEAPCFHWSDIDPDGVQIFLTVARALGRPLAPHLTSADLAERHGTPIAADRMKRRGVVPSESSIAPLAAYLASPQARAMEQEELDPRPPSRGCG